MEKSYSRKEVREKLGLSDPALRRLIKKLGIECQPELLHNGITSLNVSEQDYYRIAEACKVREVVENQSGQASSEVNTALAIMNLRNEINIAKNEIAVTKAEMSVKDEMIDMLQADKSVLVNEKTQLQAKCDEILTRYMNLAESSQKSWLQRIFKK